MKRKNISLENDTVIKDYTIQKKISNGGFSFVYLAINNLTSETVAIKEYIPNSMVLREKGCEIYFKNSKDEKRFKNGLDQFFNEMSIISHIKHNNIIDIIDYFELNNTAYIVTPYEYGMPLSQYVVQSLKNNTRIKEIDLIKIIIGILEAIAELHRNDILHLDIKPTNIWLRPNKEILLLDFGTSMEKNKLREYFFFTPGYAAPEQYKRYYKALDLGVWTDYYGLGTTLFNLLTRKLPTDSVELFETGKQIDIFDEYQNSGFYHPNILEAVNLLCQLKVEDRKSINLTSIIKTIKDIYPFNYNEKDIADLIVEK